MVRELTLERQGLKQQAIILRKMGWTQQKIADNIGVPQRTVSFWFSSNDNTGILAKRRSSSNNATSNNIAKPTFLSWCGKVEDFFPAGGIKFDLIIADPPWNISINSEINRKARSRSLKKSFGEWDFFSSDDAYLSTVSKWMDQLYRIANTPSWCWFWCSYRYLSYIATISEQIGWTVHNWFNWIKTNPAPLMGANNFLHAVETMLILRKGNARLRFDDGHLPNVFSSPQVKTTERVKDFNGDAINLTQKPIPLLSMVIPWCSDQGQWVLDAFAGTGSASLAALKNNRNCFAVEVDRSQLTHLKGRLQKEGFVLDDD